ncbi:mitochondrial carrier protein [Exidia glandulosa HHB12029]|uniref:Mitochondrial carrier protein n=1 Tax=Exidia glandulosa HHB12029 TaxID=1314781 RepID=A0A165M8C2_EXIGL|nr:mitochondrial carrier protein [Exidia glandulosa HHB12029]
MAESTVDERTPLVNADGSPKVVDDHTSIRVEQIQRRPSEDEAAKALEDKPDEWTRWDVFVWAFWIIAGVAFVVWFIKGIRESDDVDFDLRKALKDALGGGLSGAAAMVLQVLTLMPLRTIMNYQYRYGTTTKEAARTLYADGGYARYYAGLGAALFQGPIARFGDTAANAGILALMQSNPTMKKLPVLIQTVFASLCAAGFRMILTPIDTIKTTLQTQGSQGWALLKNRIKVHGIGTMWYGAFGTAAATFVGHYPWFATYNFLDKLLDKPDGTVEFLARQAFIGFSASVISDTASNSLRVLKTYRQVNPTRISYRNAARAVLAADGVRGLFGRGLGTRILTNGLQGLLFSILWKLFMNMCMEE